MCDDLSTSFLYSDANTNDRKRQLRQNIIKQLRSMSSTTLASESAKMTRNLISLRPVVESECVAVFVSFSSGEIQTRDLILWFFAHKKRVFVPKVVDYKAGVMCFVEIHSLTDDIVMSDRGVPEPIGDSVSDVSFDLVVVPGVAFDSKGNRLGRGGGFYDRFLAAHSSKCVIGICFDFQLVEGGVPVLPYDIPVSTVVTPTMIKHTR